MTVAHKTRKFKKLSCAWTSNIRDLWRWFYRYNSDECRDWWTVNRRGEEKWYCRNYDSCMEVTRQFCYRNVKKVTRNLLCKRRDTIFWLLQNYSQFCESHCLLYTTRFSVYNVWILPTPCSVFCTILGINNSCFHLQYSLINPIGSILYCLQSKG